MRCRSAPLWEIFNGEREQLQARLSQQIRTKMASLVNNQNSLNGTDILLVANDGEKIAAHLCILRQRAPIFFTRYLQPILDATPRGASTSSSNLINIQISDVNSSGLEFFLRSVYTDEEVGDLLALNNNNNKATYSSKHNSDDDNDEDFKLNEIAKKNISKNKNNCSNFQQKNVSNQHQNIFSETNGANRVDNNNTLINKEIPTDDFFTTSDFNGVNDSKNNQMSASFTSSDISPSQQQQQQQIVLNDGLAQSSTSLQLRKKPHMTSFRELASSSCESRLCSSGFLNTSQPTLLANIKSQNTNILSSNINNSDNNESPASPSITTRSQSLQSRPFFQWIGDEDVSGFSDYGDSSPMSQSFPRNIEGGNSLAVIGSIRYRTLNARRLSVASLNSLTSFGSTSTLAQDGPMPAFDSNPASQLCADLLQMYLNNLDTDISLLTSGGEEILAHKCILSNSCEYFYELIKHNNDSSNRIDLKRYSKDLIHFLMEYLYGGVTCVPENLDIWELIDLSEEFQLDDLFQVAYLHLRTYKCHFFHRPCASCVSAIFDALPMFYAKPRLNPLYENALAWQSRHFARIWKGRVFSHLNEKWQKACYDALLQAISEENVIDVLLSCEKLQVGLFRLKTQNAAKIILRMVGNVVEYCMDFSVSSFHLIIASKGFQRQGKGLALNLAILEDIFPTLIHSLSPEIGIKTLINLKDLLIFLIHDSKNSIFESPTRRFENEWNSKFINLCKRLHELTDKHLLHHASSVIKSPSWNLLNNEEKNRINEAGIFVEMQMPLAPPPKLSSLNRAVPKRSISAGGASINYLERTRSLERARPTQIAFMDGLEKRPMEAIMEREKSQNQLKRTLANIKNHHQNLPESSKNQIEEASESRENLENLQSKNILSANKTSSKIPSKIQNRNSSPNKIISESAASTLEISLSPLNSAIEKNEKLLNMNTEEKSTIISNKISLVEKQKNKFVDNNGQQQQQQQKTPQFIITTNIPSKRKSITSQIAKKQKQSFQKNVEAETESLQRQNTQTIMTVKQNREAGITPVEMTSSKSPFLNVNNDQNVIPPLSESTDLSLTTTQIKYLNNIETNPIENLSNSTSIKNTKPQSIVRPMPKTTTSTSVTSTTITNLARSRNETTSTTTTPTKSMPKTCIEKRKPQLAIEERGRRRRKVESQNPLTNLTTTTTTTSIQRNLRIQKT